MNKGRLEAFSDGVIAILITIMVLELHVPEGDGWDALQLTVPILLMYLLSFVFLGIYWSNHHHMFQAVHRVNGAVLWANLHLLFWLSLVPFVTRWLGEKGFAPIPTAIYGVVLLLSAIAYTLLQRVLIAQEGPESKLARATQNDMKGKLSLLLYATGVATAFVHPGIADALYVIVALIWLVPDKRIESLITDH
jgi:TMEM175 potassium channel family protein